MNEYCLGNGHDFWSNDRAHFAVNLKFWWLSLSSADTDTASVLRRKFHFNE
jgi:hypothetical protein